MFAYTTIEQTRTHEEQEKHTVLEKEIALLRERLHDKQTENERLWNKLDIAEKRIDKLTDTISQQTILLTDQRTKSTQKPAQRNKSFLATLIAKK